MQVNSTSASSGEIPRLERPDPAVPRSTMPEDVRDAERVTRVAGERESEPETEVPRPLTEKDVSRVVDLVNELAQRLNVKVMIRRSENSEEFRLTVINRETGEVIREVPPEEMIAHLENFSGFEGMLTNAGV